MVEAKSLNMDADQNGNWSRELTSHQLSRGLDPTGGPQRSSVDVSERAQKLARERWQSLVALHRTLLYEHHDFLMATQHPTANTALRGLAAKYCMPARMWKHGIHAFLGLLQHERSELREFERRLTFIHLAYEFLASLTALPPDLTDTWIECLGDLARYRMAIDQSDRTELAWSHVAARWYSMASDRHPRIGRLYHHLGILESSKQNCSDSAVPKVLARLRAAIKDDDETADGGAHPAMLSTQHSVAIPAPAVHEDWSTSHTCKIKILDTGLDMLACSLRWYASTLQPGGSFQRLSEQPLDCDPSDTPITGDNFRRIVQSIVADRYVDASVDTGASANFTSHDFVTSLGLSYDRTKATQVQVANAIKIPTLGTVRLPFRFWTEFWTEPDTYSLIFHVIHTTEDEVILGRPFLDRTGTLGRYASRMKRMQIDQDSDEDTIHQQQQSLVRGELNERSVHALADTAADVSLMSLAFATKQGLEIDTTHIQQLELGGCFSVNTCGTVVARWKYNDGMHRVYPAEFHVLDGLSYEVILSDSFLTATDGLDLPEQCYVSVPKSFNGLTLNVSRKKRTKKWGSSKAVSTSATDPTTLQMAAYERALAEVDTKSGTDKEEAQQRATSLRYQTVASNGDSQTSSSAIVAQVDGSEARASTTTTDSTDMESTRS